MNGPAVQAGQGDKPIDLAARRAARSGHPANLRSAGAERVVIVSSTGNPVKPSQVSFDRQELQAILHIYGFKVADGDWRDYAIDHLKDSAVFSVYRRSTEAPLFRIVKQPKLARKQGAYSVVAQSGAVLKRGHELAQVLKVFARRLKVVG